MKFSVRRTSSWDFDGTGLPPCEGAKREKIIKVDVRSTDDPKKIPCYKNKVGQWYADGKNHRVVNGNIMRDLEWDGWTIEFKSFKALMAFIEKEGRCIISQGEDPELPEIEIYDDYRE